VTATATRRTAGMDIPHNTEAEESLLGAMMLSRSAIEEALRFTDAADFYVPLHRRLFDAMKAMHDRGVRVDPITLMAELDSEGASVDKKELLRIQGQTPLSANAIRYAQIVAEQRARRDILAARDAIGALAADLTIDVNDVVQRSVELVQRAALPMMGNADPNVAEFIDAYEPERWVLPGLIQHQERLLIVAGAKAGKSTMLRQIAVCASAGLHPFRFYNTRPVRVLMVDLENPPNLARKKLKPMIGHLLDTFPDGDPPRFYDPNLLHMTCRPGGIDVGDRADELWLYERVEANAAAMGGLDMLIIGPVYKMDSEADLKNEGARRVMRVLDNIRIRYDCAVLMEMHAPQESFRADAKARSIRPMGPRKWTAWPEFCRAVEPADGHPGCCDFYDVEGARDEREWPTLLRRGGSPWLWSEEGYDR